MLAGGSRDGTLVVWDEDGNDLFDPQEHDDSVNQIRWNKQSSNVLVTGGQDMVMTYLITINSN
jgi:WD40 repeat protein